MSFLLDGVVKNLLALTEQHKPYEGLMPLWEKAVDSGDEQGREWDDSEIEAARAYYTLLVRLLIWDYVAVAIEPEQVDELFPRPGPEILHDIALSRPFEQYAVHVISSVASGEDIEAYDIDLARERMYPESRQVQVPAKTMHAFPWIDADYNPLADPQNDLADRDSAAGKIWMHSAALFSHLEVARYALYHFFQIFELDDVKELYGTLLRYCSAPGRDGARVGSLPIKTTTVPGLCDKLYYDEADPLEPARAMRMFTKYSVVVLFHIFNVVRVTIVGFAYAPAAMLEASDRIAQRQDDMLYADLLGDMLSTNPADTYDAVARAEAKAGGFHYGGMPLPWHDDGTRTRPQNIEHRAKELLALWREFGGNFDSVVFGVSLLRAAANIVLRDGISAADGKIRFEIGTYVAAAFEHVAQGSTQGGIHKSAQYVAVRSPLNIKIRARKLNLNRNQSRPQLLVWLSHDLGRCAQDVVVLQDGSLAAEFAARMRTSGAVVTPPLDTGAPEVTIQLKLRRGSDPIAKGVYDSAIVAFAMYVHQQDADDAVPLIRRRGIAFAPLSKVARAVAAGKHLSLTLWEGPLDSDFTIDTKTFLTDQQMKYFATGVVDTMVLGLPGAPAMGMTGAGFGATAGRESVGSKKPFQLVASTQYEKDLNRAILQAMKVYSGAHDSPQYHVFMYLLWPGTPTFRHIGLEVDPPAHTIGFYEALLRHQLWRDNISEQEFARIHAVAYSADHKYRVFAHERFWWVVTMALTFVNACMYKLDKLQGRDVEIMENITIAMAGDCEDDSTPLYLAVQNLRRLPRSGWKPLRLVQAVLARMLPLQMVMTTAASSLGGAGGVGSAAAAPALHSTCILMPAWFVFPDRASGVPDAVRAIEKPRILEGTGVYAGWLMSIHSAFPGGDAPDPIFDSVEKYTAIRRFFTRDSPFDAPTVGDLGVGVRPYKAAEEHPFFGHCVSVCGSDLGGGDKLLLFHTDTPSPPRSHNFPHFSAVLANRTDLYKFRGGPTADMDVSEYVYLARYFPPAPVFDGTDIPLPEDKAVKFRSFPLHSVHVGRGAQHAAQRDPRADADADMQLLQFRACTVFMNARAAADSAEIMREKIDAFVASSMAPKVKTVDWKVVQFMHGVVQYEIRVTY